MARWIGIPHWLEMWRSFPHNFCCSCCKKDSWSIIAQKRFEFQLLIFLWNFPHFYFFCIRYPRSLALDVCCTFNACSLLLACKLLAYPANTFAWVLCLILSSLSAEKEPEEPSEETESLWFLRTFWVPSWNSWFTEADWSKAQLQIKAGFSVILTWHLRLPVLFAFLHC